MATRRSSKAVQAEAVIEASAEGSVKLEEAPAKKAPVKRNRKAVDHQAMTVKTARSTSSAAPKSSPASKTQLRAVPALKAVAPAQQVDMDKVQEAVEAMAENVINCRSLSHHWVPQNARAEENGHVIVITTRCASCESVRDQFIGSRSGELVAATQIKYTKGYLLAPGIEAGRGVARGFSRLNLIGRLRNVRTA